MENTRNQSLQHAICGDPPINAVELEVTYLA